jgi:hypothetical protein
VTIAIRMKGDINEILVPATFQQFVAELNVAGATGKQYVIMNDTDENPIALNTQNILTVRGVGADEEAASIG